MEKSLASEIVLFILGIAIEAIALFISIFFTVAFLKIIIFIGLAIWIFDLGFSIKEFIWEHKTINTTTSANYFNDNDVHYYEDDYFSYSNDNDIHYYEDDYLED